MGGDSTTYIFDGHNDLAWAVRELSDAQPGHSDIGHIDIARGDGRLHTDLPRLREGGVGAQFWSVYVPCSLTGDAAVTATLEQIDWVRALVDRHPTELALAVTADEVRTAVDEGRIASLLGMEGGHSINSSLGTLRMMHALGVRYLTLTHNENVPWADSATDFPCVGGLNEFGREVVQEMNRLGMFVDLSHVSAAVMRDALDVSAAPVIFSHSCAQALCDINRNVPDDVLTRLGDNRGVCMVTFVPMFVTQPVANWYAECLSLVEQRGGDPRRFEDVNRVIKERTKSDPPPPCTVADVADHVEHVREVAGLHSVGVGGDYDGALFFPQGMADVSSYPLLLDVLRKRGWSTQELRLLGHGNVLRAMRDMEAAAVHSRLAAAAPAQTDYRSSSG